MVTYRDVDGLLAPSRPSFLAKIFRSGCGSDRGRAHRSAERCTGRASSTPHAVLTGALEPTPQTITWEVPGTYTYTVLPLITSLDVMSWGAEGGSTHRSHHGPSGGARVTTRLSVTPGEELQINFCGKGGDGASSRYGGCDATGGAGGYNGGGSGGAGCYAKAGGAGRGGPTDIRKAPFGPGQRLVVAAGAGGTSTGVGTPSTGVGGSGGGLTGDRGQDAYWPYAQGQGSAGGGGGTQTEGGPVGPVNAEIPQTVGALATGGSGGAVASGAHTTQAAAVVVEAVAITAAVVAPQRATSGEQRVAVVAAAAAEAASVRRDQSSRPVSSMPTARCRSLLLPRVSDPPRAWPVARPKGQFPSGASSSIR